MSATQSETVDPAEVAKFEAMAAEWWNPEGKFKPLHMLQPCRLGYVVDQIAAEFGRDLVAGHLAQVQARRRSLPAAPAARCSRRPAR